MEHLRGELDEMKEQMAFLMLDIQDLVSGQELLKEENHQLKTQLNLVMEILNTVLRKEDKYAPASTTRVSIPPCILGDSSSLKSVHASPLLPCVPGYSRPEPVSIVQKYPRGKAHSPGPSQHERKFDPIPMLYAQLLPQLLKFQLVELRIFTMHGKLPRDYVDNARCDFHSGAPCHDTENCMTLKHKVQDLLDEGIILFTPRGLGVRINVTPSAHATISAAAAPQKQTYVAKQDNQQRPRVQRKFDPLPMSYTELFSHLMKLKLIELHTWKVDPNKLPNNFNVNARCAFHSNGQGHTIENCMAFKHMVQDLLDSEAFNFGPTPTPDAIHHPLPTYVDATVNAIVEDESLNLVKDVNLMTAPLSFVKERLLRKGDAPNFPTATGAAIPPYTLENSLNPKARHASTPSPCIPRSPCSRPIPIVQRGLEGKALQSWSPHSENQFDPIPMPYAQLLPQLLKFRLVELQTLAMPEGILFEYDVMARCDFHSGAPCHDTEDCVTLKNEVQDLLDKGIIWFPPTGLSIQANFAPVADMTVMPAVVPQNKACASKRDNRPLHPPAHQAPRQKNQKQQENRALRRFDVVPMTYAGMLTQLLELKLIVPKAMLPSPPPDKCPSSYDTNAVCAFHSGTVGHNIEDCHAFKCKVQDLIESKAISFTPDGHVG